MDKRTEWVIALLTFGFSLAFLILASKFSLTLPGAAVDISLQSLAVILIAMVTRIPIGRMVVLTYLILGLAGLPVFSDGAGIEYFRGPPGGYLLGFLAAVFVLEYWKEGRALTLLNLFLANLLGTAIILLCGMLYLAYKSGLDSAYHSGVEPFLPGAGIKILAGTLILWLWARYFRKKG